MGLNDTPPPHVPAWLPVASTLVLGIGAVCWNATYILITIRSIKTKSYGMPLMATVLNWSWEVIYAFYVAEHPVEFAGLAVWFFLDLGMVYTTAVYAPYDWKMSNPWIGKHMLFLLVSLTAAAIWGNYTFAEWWVSRPGVGHGDKTGKWYRHQEGYDVMEMAYWSALIPQAFISAGSLAMPVSRGHSGGVSYAIWFVRALGSFTGLIALYAVMRWYWPEAHSFFVNPLAIFLSALFIIPDAIYPLVLYHVRKTEVELPDGRLVSAYQAALEKNGINGVEEGQGVVGDGGEGKIRL
ncbi:hypothetical protein GGTG_09148 [Gaeumannomyces tritici R3-111a-1]|uniref:Integral membrane protein n=1 Tax=Gaeumannomyces tritici (strain R3-111a-1) TaxID=644352 RepID=J3P6K7_GAET3|nr:hypothetical protein GGTG_09148 [Gaeumannomyces tritici R3-111a-1]EJT72282.1 hypothetical protein GGTG_09148 [Gaeumannomyces tritici R3-111a-1]